MNNTEKKHNWKYTIFAILIVFGFCGMIYMFTNAIIQDKKKETKPTATVQPIIDHKQQMVDSLLVMVNRLVASTNGSKQSIIIQREDFRTGYEGALQTSPDVCVPTIKTMYRQAMKMDSTSQAVIRRQDSTIVGYSNAVGQMTDIVALQKFQLQQKADSIAGLKDEKKLTAKANKKERRKQIFRNVLTNAGSFGLGFLGGKIIP